jgi:hypothetical protein
MMSMAVLLDQQHRHALLHVLARGLAHDPPAGVVELHRHDRAAATLVESGLRVLDAVARDDERLLHEDGRALLVVELVGAEGRGLVLVLRECLLAGTGGMLFGHHAHFEGRGAAEDLLRARRVLHARELHHDAIDALLLHDRLGDAELVHAIAQRLDVLLQRLLLLALRDLGLDARDERRFAARLLLADHEIGHVGERLQRRRPLVGLAEADHDAIAFAPDAGVIDFLVAEQPAHITEVALDCLVPGGLHVDLQQEVHAAAQVEPEVHGLRAERLQPRRRIGHEVERHDVARAGSDLRLDHVAGLELRVGVGETEAQR